MTTIIVLKPEEITPRPDLVGKWLDESHYHTLIESDTDLYLPPDCSDFTAEANCDNNLECNSCSKGLNEQNIIFKFRKNFFNQEEINSAYAGLKDAAVETQNRGIASGQRVGTCAGREWVTDLQFDILEFFMKYNTADIFGNRDPKKEIDIIRKKYKLLKCVENKGVVWLTEKVKSPNFIFDKFMDSLCDEPADIAKEKANDIFDNYISKTTYANVVNSGIAGWYSRYPRFPYLRSTSYTRDNFDKFKLAYPFLQSLAKGFKKMLPWRFENQQKVANAIDPKFVVPKTPFTTITVNKSFRTAAHYDEKNLPNGMANLCVFSKNDNYSGCYLIFPEIGYAVNIRPGDLLLVQNQCGLHGNSPLILNDPTAERISCIAFTHESMLSGGSYEYEEYRFQFVKSRILNPDHPEQRNRWNGISPGIWADIEDKNHNYENAREWYDFLKLHPKGDEWLNKHHPWLIESFENNGLEKFFI